MVKRFVLTPEIQTLLDQAQPVNPHWIAGFTAGEGSFGIQVFDDPTVKLGKRAKINFTISQYLNNIHLLWLIQQYFKIGGVDSGGRNMARYQVGGYLNG